MRLPIIPFFIAAVVLVPGTTAAQAPLSLRAALDSTLTRHPAVQIGLASAEASRGALLGAGGAFDTIVAADVGHQHRDTPCSKASASRWSPALTGASTAK